MFIYIFLVFFALRDIFCIYIVSNRQLTGCWQVRNQSTLQRSRGKITNIPPTTRNYSLFLQCNAMLIRTSPLLYICLSVCLCLRCQGHNFYLILIKLGTDLWSIKRENESNNRFPLSPIFTQNWHLNNAFSIDVLKYFSDINCRPI